MRRDDLSRPLGWLTAALQTMRRHRVRRLPVIGAEKRLKGILSLDEITLHSRPVAETGIDAPVHAEIAETLKAIQLSKGIRRRMRQTAADL